MTERPELSHVCSRPASMLAALKLLFTHPEQVTRGRPRDKTIISPHGKVDMSDHSPNHHRTWPGLWKSPLHGADASSSSQGKFSKGSQRPRVISAEEQEGKDVITLAVCPLWYLFKILKGAYGCGLRADLESYIEKHHYQHDDSGLLSFKKLLSKMT